MSLFRRRSKLSLCISALIALTVAVLLAPHYEQVAEAARITLDELLNRLIVVENHVGVLEEQVLPEGGADFANDVTVSGDLNVSGGIGSAGNAIVGGGVQVGTANMAASQQTSGMLRWFDGKLQVSDGIEWRDVETRGSSASSGAVFRWAEWSTYEQNIDWFATNNSAMFGGVAPSQWSDNGAIASQMSTDPDVLGTLFNKTCHSGPNATVVAEEWRSYSSTNSKHAGALFRIRNTTSTSISWNVIWYSTCYPSWGEKASISVNGASAYVNVNTRYASQPALPITLTMPPNQTSTVIFVVGSAPAGSAGDVRACFLAFGGNCLALPAGLEYVDDLNEILQ